MTRLRGAAVATGIAVLICALAALAYVQSATAFRDSESYAQRMHGCEAEALGRLGAKSGTAVDVNQLIAVSNYCYTDIGYADGLGESNIRRGMYIHQRYENNVILFMVVLITLSGVALAAMQLWTSYHLAATGHIQGEGATELTVEQGRLAIKSSVTGLVVLVLSLAFFALYVLKVYTIQPGPELDDQDQADVAPAVAAPASTPAYEPGGGPGWQPTHQKAQKPRT